MDTYLITGASGFIGSHLAEKLLKEGKKVINIDNFNDYYELSTKIQNTIESTGINYNKQVIDKPLTRSDRLMELKNSVNSDFYTLEIVDIRDLPKLEKIFFENKIDTVIHLAARAGVRPSIDEPILYQEVNCRGTQNILECCRRYGVKNIVAASSSSVYGNNKIVPFKETDIVDFAISPYAATKKANEVMGHVYHSLYKMNIVFLRFFTVYGPRQRPDLAIHKFTKLILTGKEIPVYGDGSTSRDYTYIGDIVDGICRSINYVENNEGIYDVFNIGSNSPVSLKKMIETIENSTGEIAKINRLPMQPGDVQRTYADITKLMKTTGYKPSLTFEEGVLKFVEWYRKSNS